MSKGLGQQVADEALAWVGTPFVWGQSEKGVGCDCKGLLTGVMRELGRPEAASIYAAFGNYRVDRAVPSALLVEGFGNLFERVVPGSLPSKVGDILLLNHHGMPAHMAIFVGNGRAVHAYPGPPGPRSKVCSRELPILFHKHPLHSAWRCRRVAK